MHTTTANRLPYWRGFNLPYFFLSTSDCTPVEDDFRWIAEWGFNFVRIPMCYRLWTQDEDLYRVKEEMLVRIDRTVALGEKWGLHVCLNFHRGPGFSVSQEHKEPFSLWKDQTALDAFVFHWSLFARRYRGIASEKVSFNLINEPPDPERGEMTRADYARVVRTTTTAIRAIDPQRLVIADGMSWANMPTPELRDLAIGQSCRGYLPMGVSHFAAPWVKGGSEVAPRWPGGLHEGQPWDRTRLAQHYQPWIDLMELGVGVHCGEFGCLNRTPHPVALTWLADVLDIFAFYGIGYALWHFRGTFGVLDSGRSDVAYENWHGHQLDRRLLELLQAGSS